MPVEDGSHHSESVRSRTQSKAPDSFNNKVGWMKKIDDLDCEDGDHTTIGSVRSPTSTCSSDKHVEFLPSQVEEGEKSPTLDFQRLRKKFETSIPSKNNKLTSRKLNQYNAQFTRKPTLEWIEQALAENADSLKRLKTEEEGLRQRLGKEAVDSPEYLSQNEPVENLDVQEFGVASGTPAQKYSDVYSSSPFKIFGCGETSSIVSGEPVQDEFSQLKLPRIRKMSGMATDPTVNYSNEKRKSVSFSPEVKVVSGDHKTLLSQLHPIEVRDRRRSFPAFLRICENEMRNTGTCTTAHGLKPVKLAPESLTQLSYHGFQPSTRPIIPPAQNFNTIAPDWHRLNPRPEIYKTAYLNRNRFSPNFAPHNGSTVGEPIYIAPPPPEPLCATIMAKVRGVFNLC